MLSVARYVSAFEIIKFYFGLPNTICRIHIKGHDLVVRRYTLDLYVAATCLGSEYKPISNLFPKNFNGVFVDAGSYIGTAALALSDLYPKAKIICLEPSTENFKLLKKNVTKRKNISCLNCALVSSNSTSSVLSDRRKGQCGYTVVSKPEDVSDVQELHSVETLSLLSKEISYQKIDFLKCDIEGAECDILEHDFKILKTIPFVYIELHDRIDKRISSLFFKFTKDRTTILAGKEKYLSISKSY